jgi:hypothetical protein
LRRIAGRSFARTDNTIKRRAHLGALQLLTR